MKAVATPRLPKASEPSRFALTFHVLDKAIVFAILTVFCDFGIALLSNPNRPIGPQLDFVRPLFAAARYGLPLCYLLLALTKKPPKQPHRTGVWYFLPFLVLAFGSVLWSVVAAESLSGVGAASFLVLSLVIAHNRLGTDGFLRVVSHFLRVAVFTSAAVALLAPAIGVHSANDITGLELAGSWRGAFLHKNYLAPISLLLFAITYSRVISTGRWVRLLVLAVSFGVLIMAGSASSIAALAVFLGSMTISRAQHSWIIVGIIALICTILLQLTEVSWELVLAYLGRDSSLTGRPLIWSFWLERAMDTPWLGHGYVAAQQSEVNQYFAVKIFAAAVHAHSGYLDLFYNLGLAGISTFFLPVVLALHKSFTRANRQTDPYALFLFSSLLALLTVAFFDVTILGYQSQLGSITLAIVLCCLEKDRKVQRGVALSKPKTDVAPDLYPA